MEGNVCATPWVVGRGLGLSLGGSEVEILDCLDAILLLLRCGGETGGGGGAKQKQATKKTLETDAAFRFWKVRAFETPRTL